MDLIPCFSTAITVQQICKTAPNAGGAIRHSTNSHSTQVNLDFFPDSNAERGRLRYFLVQIEVLAVVPTVGTTVN
jgi:hypothetical protein